MKQFFGAFFGSCLGILVTGLVITIIFVVSIASLFSEAIKMKTPHIVKHKENTVLRIDLNGDIKERGVNNPFGDLDLGPFMPKGTVGLNDIIESLKNAKSDSDIKGIYLEVSDPQAGFATIEEVRKALLEFKTSGKFIYAYSEGYSQKGYYLASTANKLYLNPQGSLEIKGLSSQIMFYKKMLDKLNVEVQIFRHGKFKSAIEPFMLDKMSDANREQVEIYLGSLWGHMISGIGESRNISVKEINDMADHLSIRSPEDALKYNLVDALKYEDEVFSAIKKNINIKDSDKISFLSLDDYSKSAIVSEASKDKIAIIYAVGEIESGEGDDDKIGSARIAKAIRDARLDNTIKAIVFRVNSPGGSALASDVIWRETVLAQKTKPFIVSMGDVAASGGYYISCAADRIFAQPNTITGSIGVFGMIPNAQKALSEKLGITVDTVNTNKHSDVGTILRGVTTEEFEYVQQSVENIYDVFISKVALGRKTSKNKIDSIGQGRVWSGMDAIKINLVDELGGIKDAIAYAAKQAKLRSYKTVDLPKQKDPIQDLFDNTKDEMETRAMKTNLGGQYIYIKQLKNVLKLKGVQARLPYEMIIE